MNDSKHEFATANLGSRIQAYEAITVTAALLAGLAASAIFALSNTTSSQYTDPVYITATYAWSVACSLNLYTVVVITMILYFGHRLQAYSVDVRYISPERVNRFILGTMTVRRSGVQAFLLGVPATLVALLLSVIQVFDGADAQGTAAVFGFMLLLTILAIGWFLREWYSMWDGQKLTNEAVANSYL